MDNKTVQTGVNNIVDFIAMLWNGVESAIGVIPPIIQGFIVLALFLIWAFNKVKH